MNENLYVPLVLLGVELTAIVAVMVFLHWRAEKSSKEAGEKMASFIRHMQIESEKTARIGQNSIAMAQKTLNDNAMFLRMIFERVDKRNNPET